VTAIDMATLSGYVDGTSGERCAFTDGTRNVTYSDLSALLDMHSDSLDKLNGANVALIGSCHLDMALLFVLLDGRAGRLILLPNCLENEQKELFYTLSGVTAEVSLNQHSILNIQRIGNSELSPSKETEWVVLTSGTTATPKLVVHTLATMTHSTKRSTKDTNFKWGMAYDLNKFAGIQVFLQAITSGSCLVFIDRCDSFADAVELLVDKSCNALSGTPTFWRKLLMAGTAANIPLQRLTLGGEIVDQNILGSLATMYPNATIRHIYASTECGVAITVSDGQAGFPEHYLSNTPDSVQLKVSDDDILFIKPAQGKQHYLSDIQLYEDDGFIDSGDVVTIEAGRVLFLGRDNGSINVGGNKVFPEDVELALGQHHSVGSCLVSGKKNNFTGSIVVASVVLIEPYASDTNQHVDLKRSIKEHCKSKLASFKVPAIISIVDSLDVNDSGKLNRL
jgi:acyl-coenzyme A synthetase/AMP-(fatty) acid ligase